MYIHVQVTGREQELERGSERKGGECRPNIRLEMLAQESNYND